MTNQPEANMRDKIAFVVLVLIVTWGVTGCGRDYVKETGAGLLTGGQNPDSFIKCVDFEGNIDTQIDGASPIVSGRGAAMGKIRTFGVVSKGTWSPEAQTSIASMCQPPQESITSTNGTVTIQQQERKVEFKAGDGSAGNAQ